LKIIKVLNTLSYHISFNTSNLKSHIKIVKPSMWIKNGAKE